MPRTRYIKPEFFNDEDLAELAFQTRLTYAGLWCYADRAGRLEDRPRYLKAMIFPYDDLNIEKELQTLSTPKHRNGMPFILRYEIEGKKYIQIVSWEKYQRPHHTEPESNIPPPPPYKNFNFNSNYKYPSNKLELCNGALTVKEPLNNGALTVKEPSKLKTKPTETKDFLTSIKENPAYSHIDIDNELWKTARFIVNWLNKIEKPIPIETNDHPPKEKPAPVMAVDRDGTILEQGKDW
jgi:hypothetical protein